MKLQKGFSLIELMIVIAIIGVLSAVAVVSYQEATKSARNNRRVADVQQIRSALEMYRSDVGGYPTDAQGLNVLTASYLKNGIPQGPKGESYPYDGTGTCTTSCTGYQISYTPEGGSTQNLVNP